MTAEPAGRRRSGRERPDRSVAPGTLRLYRHVLRGFASNLKGLPRHSTSDAVREYLGVLADRNVSASWTASTISVLRTALDKLGGLDITSRIRGPRRGRRLPEIVSDSEAHRVLAAAGTVRDRLLLGLLYGCGLKAGEAAALLWGDVDPAGQRLRVQFRRGTRERWVPIPGPLLAVLTEGVKRCASGTPVFEGRRPGRPLSGRMVELAVRRAAQDAGIGRPISAMTLRHAYGVRLLEMGQSVREVQERLGHLRLETTLLYSELLPKTVGSPLDRLQPTPPTSPESGVLAALPDLSVAPFDIQSESLQSEPGPTDPAASREPQPGPVPASTRPIVWLALLKTRIVGRFLALRRACGSDPPGT